MVIASVSDRPEPLETPEIKSNGPERQPKLLNFVYISEVDLQPIY